MLPDYIAKASPNPIGKRGPWYANTAPSYAGIFLGIAFYRQIADGTLTHAGFTVCFAGLVIAAVLCYALYYFAPAMLGMKTGLPLYVVGSSTFGTTGGYLMPGLLMGLLQIGWFAVNVWTGTDFVLKAIGLNAPTGTPAFILTGTIIGLVFAFIGAKGIQYVAKVALFLNFVPLLMIIIVLVKTPGSAFQYQPPAGAADAYLGMAAVMAAVIGFSATAAAAGTDFGTSMRNAKDVRWGGLVGITLAAIIAGGLPLAAVAAAKSVNPAIGGDYADVIQAAGGVVSSSIFVLFALAVIPSLCFCIFIAGNSFSTMIPGVPRVASSLAAGVVGIILAVTGLASNLIKFFSIVGASFGPICGAMAADYLLSGRRWAGPRQGINFAGYIAWAVGFGIGIMPSLTLAPLYSFIAGFVVYAILAKAGLQPKVVEMAAAKQAQ
jgi:cytosine permease